MFAGIDWAIIVIYLLFTFLIGILVKDAASKGVSGFFVAGRGMRWWWLGTSIVATTFASDTPLVITGWVANYGIAGNWFWWGGVIGSVAMTVFFARKWRTTEVITDVELTELRYGGKPAAVLRMVKAFFSSIVVNCIILGWVFAAMYKIAKPVVNWQDILGSSLFLTLQDIYTSVLPFLVFKDFNNTLTIGVMVSVVVIYSTFGGLKAVIVTDLFQFILAMSAAYGIAWLAVDHVGGLAALWEGLENLYPSDGSAKAATDLAGNAYLSAERVGAFMPDFGDGVVGSLGLPFSAFMLTLGVLWWTNGGIDGSGYVAQRLYTAKTPQDAERGALWYTAANFMLRHWPWVITGVAALVVYPRMEWDMKAREMTTCMHMPDQCTEEQKICAENPQDCQIKSFNILVKKQGTIEEDGLWPMAVLVPRINACVADPASCPTEIRTCMTDKDKCRIPTFAYLQRVDAPVVPDPVPETDAVESFEAEEGVTISAEGLLSSEPVDPLLAKLSGVKEFKAPQKADYPKIEVYKEDREMTYPVLIADLVPPGLLGLAFASLMAAFMSTVSTHINWGASYMTNDFYYRFIDKKATEKRLSWASRISTILMTFIAVFMAAQIDVIGDMWILWGGIMAGLGLPHILRWLWWRANAWTEIAGLATGGTLAIGNYVAGKVWGINIFREYLGGSHGIHDICWISLFAGIAAITATFLTNPVSDEQIRAFVEKVKPMGFWKGYGEGHKPERSFKESAAYWLLGIAGVYSGMFGLGYILRVEYLQGSLLAVFGIGAFVLMVLGMNKVDRKRDGVN